MRIKIKNLVYNKKFLIAAALILSVVIWFVAMIKRNPVREQLFSNVPASITIDNTSAQTLGLGIVSDVSDLKFSVTLSGPNYIVSSVKPEDFLITASVDEVNAPGTYNLPVTGVKNSDVSGYSFASIDPPTVKVKFDYIDTKEFTVVPKITGVKADEGLVADTPIISNPDQAVITVKGPRSQMKNIKTVGSLTDEGVNKVLSSTQTYDSDIVLYDKNDKIIYRYTADGTVFDENGKKTEKSNLDLSFTSVKVTQPIFKKVKLDIKPTISNNPSSLKTNDIKFKLNHSRVTVIGMPEIVSKMTSVSLSPIDMRDVSKKKNSFKKAIVLPEGVKILDNVKDVTVTIDTGNFEEKTVTVYSVKFKDLGKGLSAKAEAIKNVKICGFKNDINKLSQSSISAEINLSDKPAGENTVDADIKFGNSKIWQIGTYSANVTIKNN